MKQKKTAFGVLRFALTAVFVIIFAVSAVMLVKNLSEKKKWDSISDELEETFYSGGFEHRQLKQIITPREDNGVSAVSGTDTAKLTKQEQLLLQAREGLSALRKISEHIYGWIFVEGTDIDYPIVKGEDNEYYLDHAFDGTDSTVGAIFVDSRCADSITDDRNTVLYGHNLLTGDADMFHDVEMFLERDFFESAYIYIYTFDGIYVYEPFSVYQARYDYNYFRTDFSSGVEFEEFAAEIKDNSRFDSGLTVGAGDRIITLSTCTNIEYFTRYALHAKLIYQIEE